MKYRLLIVLLCLLALAASGCSLLAPSVKPSTAATTAPVDSATPAAETAAPGDVTADPSVNPTQAPTEEPTPEPTPTSDPTEGMIFPDSDTRLLMWGELIELASTKLDLARNEIFARAGYAFSGEYYVDYYEKLTWYQVDPAFSEADFTDVQRANITLIRAAENAVKDKLLEIKSGTKLDYDQDGDLETLTFSAPDDYHMILKLKDGSTTTTWNVECDNPSKKVYLGDIDFNDDLLDLCVDAFGPSDDYSVFIAGVADKSFVQRGEIAGSIKQLKPDGKGVVGTRRRMNILMTWFCDVEYKLSASGDMLFVEQPSYSMGNFKCKTKASIPLMKTASSSAELLTTVPAGTEVTLVSTDDKRWIKITAPAGTGWLEMDDMMMLKNPYLPGFDAFDGLNMAD